MKTTESPFICIGHRGAMGYEPENTLRSFTKAIEMGCPWIELDVYSVEGELLVIHDDRLERTTNGTGYVQKQPFQYLRSLDAGKGERIPTLMEVFELVSGRCGINIELKGPNTAAPVAHAIDSFRTGRNFALEIIVSSFNHRELQRFKQLMPQIKIAPLIYGIPEDYAALAEKLGAYSIHCSLDFLDREFVSDAHSRNLKVFVYTVNETEDLLRVRELNVDGVFTNYPDRVITSVRPV